MLLFTKVSSVGVTCGCGLEASDSPSPPESSRGGGARMRPCVHACVSVCVYVRVYVSVYMCMCLLFPRASMCVNMCLGVSVHLCTVWYCDQIPLYWSRSFDIARLVYIYVVVSEHMY